MLRNLMRIVTVGPLSRPRQALGLSPTQIHLSNFGRFNFNKHKLYRIFTPHSRCISAPFTSQLFSDLCRGQQEDLERQLRLRTREHGRHYRDQQLGFLRLYASSADYESPESQSDQYLTQQPRSGSERSCSTFETGSQPASQPGSQAQQISEASSIPQSAISEGSSSSSHFKQGKDSHGHGSDAVGGDTQGRRVPAWKQRLGQYLESNRFHMGVISLVMLDLTIVVTELILGSLFSHGQHMPHAVHVAEEVLSWSSIGILCLFAAELVAKLTCFGTGYFTHSKWHMVDAVVITLSLGLELTLKGVAGEAASLLMFFRLWKYTPEFLRVARHAPEAAEVARVARHAPEVARMLGRTPEFVRAIRHSPEVLRVARHVPEAFRVFRHIPEFFRFARHTPELFRLWRVARIAHASAEVMALHNSLTLEEARHALASLQQALEGEQRRIKVMEAELAATKAYLTAEEQAAVEADMLSRFPPTSSASSQSSMDRVWEDGLHASDASPNGSQPDESKRPEQHEGRAGLR